MYASFRKVNLLSQYRQNGNTEVRGKRLILNCNTLKTGRRRQSKFDENAFQTNPNILVRSKKLDFNALSRLIGTELLAIPTKWECEQRFFTFLTIRSKTRNRLLNPEHHFRCSVSKISSRLEKLVEERKCSHCVHTYKYVLNKSSLFHHTLKSSYAGRKQR